MSGELARGVRAGGDDPSRRRRASGYLILEDGSVFPGRTVGAPGIAFGEAVFTTAMSGYQEIATDPSFTEQIVCFTAPMVGNYGVAAGRDESPAVAARGFAMRQCGGDEWSCWLWERGAVALDGIDTRSVVLRLRSAGAMRAAVVASEIEPADALEAVKAQPEMAGQALVAGVSTRRPYRSGSGAVHVALLDYGVKRSIVSLLSTSGARTTVWPHDTDAGTVLASRPAGVLLSNGPGDPAALPDQVAVVRELLGRVPILGICLGHQLLGLAAGFSTSKLPFGHRGANHPVLERRSGRVLVTCQNHGFAVEGDGSEVTHSSLYDGTVEGLEFPHEYACSVQFHPEAGPGPHDARAIVERWVLELAGRSTVNAKAA
jgi:carbamoyl-phosphate synthase small subunit